MAQSEIRVALDRLLELLERSLDPLCSALVPKVPPPQIKLVRLRVCAVEFDKAALLFAGQFQFQLLCDLSCNCLFNRNHVGDFAVVPYAPKLRACVSVQ